MNEQDYLPWDIIRQPMQDPIFYMTSPFLDVNSILELRKEKSRDAARSRRGKENYEFYELAKLLPLPAAITSQLDKASIIRLTISYLKLRQFSSVGDPQWAEERVHGDSKFSQNYQPGVMDPFESRQGTHILQALDGFPFILEKDGRFLYISETVSVYLGLSQVEMAGSSIFDYVHQQDHPELIQQLGMCVMPIGQNGSGQASGSDEGSLPVTPRPGSPPEKGYFILPGQGQARQKSFCLRMKSTLTKRGVQVKTSGYRVVHIVGSVRSQTCLGTSLNGSHNNNSEERSSSSGTKPFGFVGIALALPPPAINEMRLELDTFITRMSPDFRVTYCEPVISDIIDLSVEDVNDRPLYDLCHVSDLEGLRSSHLDVLNKGQALTDYYRLMNRSGGFVWVQTYATTLLNSKTSEDHNILAINFVLSDTQRTNCALDLWQVTGDAKSLKSCTADGPTREETLKEIRTRQTSFVAPLMSTEFSKSHSPHTKSLPSSPGDRTAVALRHDHEAADLYSLKTPPGQPEENMEATSPEGNNGNLDSKNKRRKMDNPRKRRRSTEKLDGKALNLTRTGVRASVIADSSNSVHRDDKDVIKVLRDRTIVTPKTWLPSSDSITSSLPEDLSIKKTLDTSLNRNIIRHSASVAMDAVSPDYGKQKAAYTLDASNHTSFNSKSFPCSTVRELESALNRHIPASTSQKEKTIYNNPFFDSASVLPAFTNPTTSRATSYYQPSLHNIYPDRESVIKAPFKQQALFPNMELPTKSLTPPETELIMYRGTGNHYSLRNQDSMDHENTQLIDSVFETGEHSSPDQYSFIPYKHNMPISYLGHVTSPLSKAMHKEVSVFKDIPSFTIPCLMSPNGRTRQPYSSFHPTLSLPITAPATPSSVTPPSPNSPDYSNHTNQLHMTFYAYKPVHASEMSSRSIKSPQIPNHYYHFPKHQNHHLYQYVRSGDTVTGGCYETPASRTSPLYMDLNQISSGSAQYEARTKSATRWY